MPATAPAKPPKESTLIKDEVMSERRKFLAKIPPINVEVAVVDVALKYGAATRLPSIPPAKVEVAEEVETM